MNHNHPAQTDDARGTLWESLVDSGQCAVAERPAERTLDATIAAAIRDRITHMRDAIGEPISAVREQSGGFKGRGKKGKRGRVPRPKTDG